MSEPQSDSRLTKGVNEFVAEAVSGIDTYTTNDAISRFGDDNVVFVDVRDVPERVAHGTIPGAIHASRGMLEFHLDPESPAFMGAFGEDKEFIFHCAVGARGALAAQRAKEMGLANVANVEGGFNAWRDADGPVEEPRPTM